MLYNINMNGKQCSKCKQIKLTTEYTTRNQGKYLASWCKSCWKDYYNTRRKELNKINFEHNKNRYYNTVYGISLSEYNKMVEECDNKCNICHEEDNRRLAVDHCHYTGKVRGLLCVKCNMSLGGYRDSIILLENAIKYLKKYS